MYPFHISQEQLKIYEDEGYVLIPDLFDEEEVDLLRKIAKADRELEADAHSPLDKDGKVTKITVRNELREDIYSAIVRSHRMADTMEKILGGEVYHYHHKMTMKEPKVGGAWEWHQDYGYWYNNGCLYPLLSSCMIAVDRSTMENGCLQVIPGSHQLGRIEHGVTGTQTGADEDRVEKVLERLPIEYVEMEPGTALFFHCNLLHRSAQNTSEFPRWMFICCYNAARNNPYKKHHHPCYEFLEKWADEKVKEVGYKQWEAIQAKLEKTR